METSGQTRFKICLIGDGGTGKTTYINRVLDGRFEKNYIATVGAVIHKVTFLTNNNYQVEFQVWDTAGQEKKAVLKDMYYIDADAAIFFFDVTSRITCTNLARWIKEFQDVVGNKKPIVVCANKIDIQNQQKVSKKLVTSALRGKTYEYVEMSAKTAYNFSVPFLHLARVLINDPNLFFISNINLEPTELNYDVHKDEDEDPYASVMGKAVNIAPGG